jgi:hypothetical protein
MKKVLLVFLFISIQLGMLFGENLNYGVWEIKYYVDEFGDETDTPYMRQNIIGNFSNSATLDDDILCIISHKWRYPFLEIDIHEYLTHKITFDSYQFVTVSIKSSNGVKKRIDAGMVLSDSGTMFNADATEYIFSQLRFGDIKVVFRTPDGSKYSFDIKNKNFINAFDEIEKKGFIE